MEGGEARRWYRANAQVSRHNQDGTHKSTNYQCYTQEVQVDQTLPIGRRESFTWVIPKTILCLVLDPQGIYNKEMIMTTTYNDTEEVMTMTMSQKSEPPGPCFCGLNRCKKSYSMDSHDYVLHHGKVA